MENEDTMKSFYDIAGKVAEIWDDLSDSERRYYLNIQAGANQTQNLAALLRNYSTVVGATNDAINSNNSAQEENAKYLDSIEGRLKALSTAWEDLSRSVVKSDLIKGSVSFLTGVVKGVGKVRDAIGTLPTALLAVAATAKGLNLMQTLLVGLPQQIAKAGGLVAMATGIAVPDAGNMGLIAQLTDARKRYQGLSHTVNEYHSQLKNVELAELAAMDARSKSNAAIQDARRQLGVTSRAEAEAVAIESRIALSEIEATGVAAETQIARANSGLKMISRSIVGIVAVTGTIMLAKKMYEVYQHSHDVNTILEDISDIESEIANKQSEINELLAKQDAGKITAQEETHLKLLEAQVRVLKLRQSLEKRKLRTAFQEDVVELGSKATTYELEQYQRGISAFATEYAKLKELESRIETERFSPEEYEKITDELTKQEKKTNDMAMAMSEYGQAIGETYVGLVEAGLTRDSFIGKDQEAFDRMHAAFLTSQIDIEKLKDSYTDVVNTLSREIDRLGFDGLIDFDLINFEKVDEAKDIIKQIRKQLKKQVEELGEDETITITAVDKTGAVIGDIEAKKDELTENEWDMIYRAYATGEWDKIEAFEATPETTEKFLEIQATLKEGGKTKGQDPLNPEVTFKVNSKKVDAKNNELTQKAKEGYEIDVTYRYQGQGNPQPFATGKNPGEPGGPAWVGDEARPGGPARPEMIVHADGSAELAGTEGWQLVNLKSSDTVYTYAQTKKLLGGKQSYQFGASEIPRYAKGKKATTSSGFANVNSKLGKKRSEASAKDIETWEYQLDIGTMLESEYITKLKKLVKQKSKLTKDQYRDLKKTIHDYYEDIGKEEADTYETSVKYGRMTYKDAKANLEALNKERRFSEDEYKEMQVDLAKTALDTAVEMVEAGVGSWEKVSAAAKEYISIVDEASAEGIEAQEELFNTASDLVAEGKISVKEYEDLFIEMYDTIDHESERYCNAEKKRHEALVKNLESQIDKVNQTLDVSLGILGKIRDIRDKIQDSIQEAKDRQQKLADIEEEQQKAEVEYAKELVRLQNELTKAKSKTVKVYKEGIGWTYQKDIEAVREAQEAIVELNEDYQEQIDDFNKQKEEASKPTETKKFSLLDAAISGIQTVSSAISTVTSIAGLVKLFGLFAGGKKPGEPGGLSILGDEATSAANPKPELVVGPNGAYLAGTQGWQIANLDSADRVYTAAETKRLLGGTNRGVIPSAFSGNAGHEVVGGGMMSNNYTYNFDRLELPNVSDANSFIKELQDLPNLAIQMTGKR